MPNWMNAGCKNQSTQMMWGNATKRNDSLLLIVLMNCEGEGVMMKTFRLWRCGLRRRWRDTKENKAHKEEEATTTTAAMILE